MGPLDFDQIFGGLLKWVFFTSTEGQRIYIYLALSKLFITRKVSRPRTWLLGVLGIEMALRGGSVPPWEKFRKLKPIPAPTTIGQEVLLSEWLPTSAWSKFRSLYFLTKQQST